MSDLLTVDEAAGRLRVRPGWLAEQVSKRRVVCTRIGRKVYFTADQVEQIIRDGEQPAVDHRTDPVGITSRSLARRVS